MKKILLMAVIAIAAMGCCKKTACNEGKCCGKPAVECCQEAGCPKADCPKVDSCQTQCSDPKPCCKKVEGCQTHCPEAVTETPAAPVAE